MTSRRPLLGTLGLVFVVIASVLLASGPAGAGEADDGREPGILVAEISGPLDPVTTDLVLRTLEEAEQTGAVLFVVTIDSPGSLDVDVEGLLRRLRESEVPVAAWVEGGGVAKGAATLVLQSADVSAMATDATVGPVLPVSLDEPGRFDDRAADLLARLADEHGRSPNVRVLLEQVIGANEAASVGLVDVTAPTLRDLIAVLDGREVTVAGETTVLALGEVVEGEDPQEKRVLPIRFRTLDLTDQLQHALTSPFVALLLFLTGLCLIAFEFFAVGVGLASLTGAGLVAAAFVGFGHLPVNAVSMGLVLGGVVAVSIDVQAGTPRFWAVVGSVLLAVGTFRFYAGSARLDPAWWQLALLVGGVLTFLLPGLASLMRARFSSPTIGREWMVGESGTAFTAVDPEGVVTVRDAPWRARATRAAGIEAGDEVTVTAVRGLMLEVEPIDPDDHDSRVASS